MRIGFVVNPIAGMGGSVGLKGTDGPKTVERARQRGAQPVAGNRALRAISVLGAGAAGVSWQTANGAMGADVLKACGVRFSEVEGGSDRPTAHATRAVVKAFIAEGVDIIVFAGGDGTARDVASVVGLQTPVVGIPCGVKMHSGVFAVTPEAAGRVIAKLCVAPSNGTDYRRVEIMDIDEDALRAGRLNARLYGFVRAPHLRNLVQHAKATPPLADEGMLEALAHEVAAEMTDGTYYLVGPGTTAKRPMDALGLSPTLLGVDIVRNGHLVAADVTQAQASQQVGGGPLAIITGVTGGQGFVFGRGNQQIGPVFIRRCWPDDVIVLASSEKLFGLPRPELIVDTGDQELDRALRGFARVRTGPRRSVMMRLI